MSPQIPSQSHLSRTGSTRRQFLAGVGSTLVLGAISPSTSAGRFSPWSEPDDALTHSGDRLSWIVSVDTGDDESDPDRVFDSLESWVERSGGSDREILDETKHAESGTATILATPAEIGVRARDQWFDDGLQSYSGEWVESIELNRTLPYAEPIEPAGEGAWQSPNAVTQTHLRLFGDGALSPDLVAFDEDMEEATLADARTVTGAADSVLTGVDTSSLTVAVIDTGVNDGIVFEDADGNSRLLETSWNAIDDETGVGAVEDGNLHGTWVAAMVAARDDEGYGGYLQEASILGIKALSDDGGGATADIANAIRYATDEGADLLTLSLGSPMFSQAIEDALANAVEQGSIPIAATGNDRHMSPIPGPNTPASSEYTIGVGSVTTDEPEDALSAYYSTAGPHNGLTDASDGKTADSMPDIAAPGCELTARVPRSRGGPTLETLTGTSMAAPAVAGVVGLYMADSGDTDFESIRERLRETARPIPKAAPEEVGAGMATADALLAGTEPESAQESSMTDEAATRGVAYQSLSGSRYSRLILGVRDFAGSVI